MLYPIEMSLGSNLRAARRAAGKKQREIAVLFEITPQAVSEWERDETAPEPDKLARIAGFLDTTVDRLLADDAQGFSDNPKRFRAPPPPISVGALPRDVPVKGNAAGGTDADFCFNGETIDYVRRPPGIARATGVFALYVTGNSMSPRFTHGELIYLTSARPPGIGDYVVVELLPTSDGGDTAGYIKRLDKRTLTKLVCSQFNPPKTLEFELKKIKAVHRVIPWNELLGA